MKFTRFITFSLISALSIGTLVGAAELNKTPVDRHFKLEDVTGDRNALHSITLENIMKVDANSYEKVSLTANDVTFEETKYDSLLGADEEILNNKEMYRGAIDAMTLENDVFMVTAAFNPMYPYASNEPTLKIAVKDKKTNEIRKETVTLPNFHSTQSSWQARDLFEINNKMYYATVEYKGSDGNKPIMKVYNIDIANFELKEIVAIEVENEEGGYTDVASIDTDGNKIYAFINMESQYKLLSYDFTDDKKQIIDVAIKNNNDSYYEFVQVIGNDLYVTSNGSIIKMTMKDLTTTIVAEYNPSYSEKYDYIWTDDHLIQNETVYVINEGGHNESYDSDPYVSAYDFKIGKILYEGKLPSMVNRGVGKGYTFADI